MYNQTDIEGNLSIENDITVGGNATIQGNMTINGKVIAYNTKQYNVGVFSSISELLEAYPSSVPVSPTPAYICVPTRGWIAGIINNDTVTMYRYNGATWISTGITIDISISLRTDIANYALQSYVDAQLSLKANSSDVASALELKANAADVSSSLALKANANSVYTKNQANTLLGLCVGDTIRVTFNVASDGLYEVVNHPENVRLIELNGEGHVGEPAIELTAGLNDVSFIFKSHDSIPNGAFDSIENIEKLYIPSYIRSLGETAFTNTALRFIECEGMTPPSMNYKDYEGLDLEDIKVHNIVSSLYTNDDNWGVFSQIITTFNA